MPLKVIICVSPALREHCMLYSYEEKNESNLVKMNVGPMTPMQLESKDWN
jgi:hypothetical protein